MTGVTIPFMKTYSDSIREVEVRDLKPKTDPKGGAKKGDKRASRRTGEADFMQGLK
jgi:hypothetical protein